jgi:hypothetical protein
MKWVHGLVAGGILLSGAGCGLLSGGGVSSLGAPGSNALSNAQDAKSVENKKARYAVEEKAHGVEMLVVEPGGKALLVVRPDVADKDCTVKVATAKGDATTGCGNHFIVGCDASAPETMPFCRIIKEVGPVRDSAYPKGSR